MNLFSLRSPNTFLAPADVLHKHNQCSGTWEGLSSIFYQIRAGLVLKKQNCRDQKLSPHTPSQISYVLFIDQSIVSLFILEIVYLDWGFGMFWQVFLNLFYLSICIL